jgi:hypothetical protein
MNTTQLCLIVLMLAAGVIGGTANHLTRAHGGDEPVSYAGNLVVSVMAAFITPLFLSLAKSTLLDGLSAAGLTGPRPNADVFVFFGFCLVAAFSARVFVRNLTETVLNLTRSQQRLTAKVDDLEGDVGEIEGELEPSVDEDAAEALAPDLAPSAVPPPLPLPLPLNKHHILQALVSRPFTWRSVAGVRKEVGLSRETATRALEELVQSQLVDKKPSKSGAWLYRITAGGRAALGLQPFIEGPARPPAGTRS